MHVCVFSRVTYLFKDRITYIVICVIIALLGILIIHSAYSASPPTTCWGVYVR